MDAASQWAHDHNHADYYWSKQTICAYVARQAMPFLKEGIRINAICPGPDRYPAGPGEQGACGSASAPTTAKRSGIEAATPLEQAFPLVYLCSDAGRAANGIIMVTDSGYFAAGNTEVYPAATPIVKFLLGKA